MKIYSYVYIYFSQSRAILDFFNQFDLVCTTYIFPIGIIILSVENIKL